MLGYAAAKLFLENVRLPFPPSLFVLDLLLFSHSYQQECQPNGDFQIDKLHFGTEYYLSVLLNCCVEYLKMTTFSCYMPGFSFGFLQVAVGCYELLSVALGCFGWLWVTVGCCRWLHDGSPLPFHP